MNVIANITHVIFDMDGLLLGKIDLDESPHILNYIWINTSTQ